MLLQPDQVLKYYLAKQFLSSPPNEDLNLLEIMEKTGFPKEVNAILSFYLRSKDFQVEELKKLLEKNVLIEVRTFRNKRLLVPKNLARKFLEFIPQKKFTESSKACGRFIFQSLKREPKTKTEIKQGFGEYSGEIKEEALDYLESQALILKIYNFSRKNFEFVPTEEVLGPETEKSTTLENLEKILKNLIQFYGPLKISDLYRFTGSPEFEIQNALHAIKKSLTTIKIDKSESAYLIEGKDLANLQEFKEEPKGFLNIIPRVDHAFSFSQDWFSQVIPLYSQLDSLVVFNGQVVGGYSRKGGFDNFVDLPKVVLNEISQKQVSLLQWTKRRMN